MAGNRNGLIATCAWVATCILALSVGSFIAEAVEGMDRSMIPLVGPLAALVMLGVSVWLTVRWARGVGAAPDAPPADGLGRRRFLAGAAGTVAGVAGVGAAIYSRISGWATVTGPALAVDAPKAAPSPRAEWADSRVQGYRTLGRTGAVVSDISLGTGQITRHADPVGLLRDALDRGVTYIDTSPDYAGSESEKAIGEAIAGRRDELFLATKFCTPEGHVRQGSSVETYIEAVEGSLARMGTEHVDLVHIHSCDSVERLMDPAAHEAFDRLKEQGKVRFLGVSTHTPRLEEVADAAIDSDRFDVMMLAYHHGAWPRQQAIIERAATQGVGVVAMKTLKGAWHQGLMEMRPEADSFTQASFKWVLANPAVGCLVVSFFESRHVDEYLFASGKQPTAGDLAVLEKYDGLVAGTHCFAHCGACLDACPEDLAINDVLRHRMYFEAYGDQKQAMQLYAKLEKQASVCTGCAAPCTGSCPAGIDIQQRMSGAHELLTLG